MARASCSARSSTARISLRLLAQNAANCSAIGWSTRRRSFTGHQGPSPSHDNSPNKILAVRARPVWWVRQRYELGASLRQAQSTGALITGTRNRSSPETMGRASSRSHLRGSIADPRRPLSATRPGAGPWNARRRNGYRGFLKVSAAKFQKVPDCVCADRVDCTIGVAAGQKKEVGVPQSEGPQHPGNGLFGKSQARSARIPRILSCREESISRTATGEQVSRQAPG